MVTRRWLIKSDTALDRSRMVPCVRCGWGVECRVWSQHGQACGCIQSRELPLTLSTALSGMMLNAVPESRLGGERWRRSKGTRRLGARLPCRRCNVGGRRTRRDGSDGEDGVLARMARARHDRLQRRDDLQGHGHPDGPPQRQVRHGSKNVVVVGGGHAHGRR